MESPSFWTLFLDTGDPMAYLLFRSGETGDWIFGDGASPYIGGESMAAGPYLVTRGIVLAGHRHTGCR